jgi:hypothetical protein
MIFKNFFKRKKHKEEIFDVFGWLNGWVECYEEKVGDGKAKEFMDWLYNQPMTVI